ncbi:MAG: fluoride efflux transporter CrcB [Candidatus Zixiibacteriota bacterium]|nr:MAG: fluoride efflux transporter CrcB [candidate division Zixibacteria bacterium]
MANLFLVGLGGFIGSISRYLISGWVYRFIKTPLFPFGTLAVNVLGCLVIGFLAGLSETRNVFTPGTRLFIFIGILGGFTTFSTFGLETFSLARDGEMLAAAGNIVLQVVTGLMAVWVGHFISQLI